MMYPKLRVYLYELCIFLPWVVCPSVFALHSAPPSTWRARDHQSSIITITTSDDNQYKQITTSNNEKLVHSSFRMESQILREKGSKEKSRSRAILILLFAIMALFPQMFSSDKNRAELVTKN